MKSTYTFILIEDIPLQHNYIRSLLETRLDLTCIGAFYNHREAYQFLLANDQPKPDLIFLDIELPGENDGLNFLTSLSGKVEPHPQVVIISAELKYAPPAYHFPVSGYVLKPINVEELHKATEKAMRAIVRRNADTEKSKKIPPSVNSALEATLVVQISTTWVEIPLNDILYIEGDNVYIKIHLKDNGLLRPRMSLRQVKEKLPPQYFMQIHASFIVRLKYIRVFADNTTFVELRHPDESHHQTVPVGSKYREDLRKWLDENKRKS